jgi:hypothetical protein
VQTLHHCYVHTPSAVHPSATDLPDRFSGQIQEH